MAAKKITNDKLLKILNDRDLKALKSIYDLRCLTQEQLYKLHYSTSLNDGSPITNSTCKKKMAYMLENGLLAEQLYQELPAAYFLTNKAIKLIREYYNLPETIWDEDKNDAVKGYFTAAELKFNNRLLAHQCALNDFFVNFCSKNPEIIYEYKDNKHIPKNYNTVIPDAILEIRDTYYFIEMDMGTESKKQLEEKWDHYKSFLNSSEYTFREKNVTILFIVDCANIEERIKLIKKTAFDSLSAFFDENFDMYIDTQENMNRVLNEKLLNRTIREYSEIQHALSVMNQKFGYRFSLGEFVRNYLNDVQYTFFMREHITARMKNNSIAPKEYALEEFFFAPLAAASKIQGLYHNNVQTVKRYGHQIKLIIIGRSEKELFDNMKLYNLLNQQNVYFTTPEKLLSAIYFHEALFVFDPLGNMYKFDNEDLSLKNYFMNIKDKK